MAPPAPLAAVIDKQGGEEGEYDKEEIGNTDIVDAGYYHSDDDGSVGNGDDDDLSSVEGDEPDPASKMANAMGRILEIGTKGKNKNVPLSSSVVLAKTVTPLQKLQQKEKDEQKAMKEKRKANRERNLTALHLPLSIATTSRIESGGKLSVAKELEQERFHRRVATRGVVALFNAITQHQKNNTIDVCTCHEQFRVLRRLLAYRCHREKTFAHQFYLYCHLLHHIFSSFLLELLDRKTILVNRRKRKKH